MDFEIIPIEAVRSQTVSDTLSKSRFRQFTCSLLISVDKNSNKMKILVQLVYLRCAPKELEL
jgi:hypothetical protein